MLRCSLRTVPVGASRRLLRPEIVSLGGSGSGSGMQVRTVTKKRLKRQAKRAKKAEDAAKGIPPQRPGGYIPKDTHVVNSMTRQEREEEARAADLKASQDMQARMAEADLKEPPLRFHMSGLTMSDRVRKLFNLSNGSQAEVVKAQKQRGMELFQNREGDTGSSAVQVIALTTRIQQIQTHLRVHKKDNSGKRGLEALFVRRRKLLDYLQRTDFESYRRVVKTLGLVR